MKIKSSIQDYEVSFFEGADEVLASLREQKNLVTVVDARVFELYRDVIERFVPAPIVKIEALETNKSFEKVGDYILEILGAKCRKNSHLLVIGGGILQDIGGFIASVLYRGIDWTLIPTTLLAQCDSCIGSKTSMNIASYKNQLGSFYAPNAVLISTAFLKTLTDDDLKSGACEGIKLAMIEGEAAVEKMRGPLTRYSEARSLLDIVRQSLDIKKVYVEEDEYDQGRRNILNYGHTFAHAIESATNYGVPHGVAVGIGIEMAVFFSRDLGFVSIEHLEGVRELLRPLTSKCLASLSSLDAAQMVRIMKTDKKNTSADITFILTRGFGQMFKHALPAERAEEIMGKFFSSLKAQHVLEASV